MPRGGKRAGAGRKPGRKLDLQARLAIGAARERLWREACQKKWDVALADATKTVAVEWEKARAARHACEPLPTYHFEDVEYSLQTDQGLSDGEEPSRVVTIGARRPKGIGAELTARVAREFGVSARTVETCWKEFRRIEKRL